MAASDAGPVVVAGAPAPRRTSERLVSHVPRWNSERAAAVVFGLGCVAAFFVLLTIGVEQSFFLDEFDYLSDRTAWDADDVFRPRNEHWSTLPILVYRGLYRIFGLHTYTPYRAVSVVMHLVVAVELRLVLRRIGLGPWLAGAVVVPWIFLGSGWQNIIWAFQMAWSAAIACALAQLLLADHDGPFDRRDSFGLAAGVAGLMCAGIAVPLTAAVGLALLFRRGWRVAAVHTIPLAVLYGIWSAAYGDENAINTDLTSEKADFVWTALSNSVSRFAWIEFGGVVLALFVAGGVALLVRRASRAEITARLAIPAGLALGAVGFLLVVASGRSAIFGAAFAREPRYLHVTVALLTPLLGAATCAVVERAGRPGSVQRSVTVVAVLVLIWMGVPGNVSEFSSDAPSRQIQRGNENFVPNLAYAATTQRDLPDDGGPAPVAAPEITIGWLREAVEDGRVDPVEAAEGIPAAVTDLGVSLLQLDDRPDPERCRPLDGPVLLELRDGDTVGFADAAVVAQLITPIGPGAETRFIPNYGGTILATRDIRVELRSALPIFPARICV